MGIAFDNSYARLGEPFGVQQAPDPVQAPALIRINEALAEELQIDPDWLRSEAGLSRAGRQYPADRRRTLRGSLRRTSVR
jgi:uncharacterized protein YdiU (UPF0061 family)